MSQSALSVVPTKFRCEFHPPLIRETPIIIIIIFIIFVFLPAVRLLLSFLLTARTVEYKVFSPDPLLCLDIQDVASSYQHDKHVPYRKTKGFSHNTNISLKHSPSTINLKKSL
jgi:hypothetical protein